MSSSEAGWPKAPQISTVRLRYSSNALRLRIAVTGSVSPVPARRFQLVAQAAHPITQHFHLGAVAFVPGLEHLAEALRGLEHFTLQIGGGRRLRQGLEPAKPGADLGVGLAVFGERAVQVADEQPQGLAQIGHHVGGVLAARLAVLAHEAAQAFPVAPAVGRRLRRGGTAAAPRRPRRVARWRWRCGWPSPRRPCGRCRRRRRSGAGRIRPANARPRPGCRWPGRTRPAPG